MGRTSIYKVTTRQKGMQVKTDGSITIYNTITMILYIPLFKKRGKERDQER